MLLGFDLTWPSSGLIFDGAAIDHLSSAKGAFQASLHFPTYTRETRTPSPNADCHCYRTTRRVRNSHIQNIGTFPASTIPHKTLTATTVTSPKPNSSSRIKQTVPTQSQPATPKPSTIPPHAIPHPPSPPPQKCLPTFTSSQQPHSLSHTHTQGPP